MPRQVSLEVSKQPSGRKKRRTSSGRNATKDYITLVEWVFTGGRVNTREERWYPREPENSEQCNDL